MPVNPESKNCIRDEMRRFKAGKLHSGAGKGNSKGPVVKNPKQALAISLSACGKSKFSESLESLGFSQESVEKVSSLLEDSGWDKQFESGSTGSKTPKKGKLVKANGLSTMDVDSRPGKQKGDQGKLKENNSMALPPVATPSRNPQSGPRSLKLKGLRSFDEGMIGVTTQRLCPPRKPRDPEQLTSNQMKGESPGEMPKNPPPDQSETQKSQNQANRCIPSGQQGAWSGLT